MIFTALIWKTYTWYDCGHDRCIWVWSQGVLWRPSLRLFHHVGTCILPSVVHAWRGTHGPEIWHASNLASDAFDDGQQLWCSLREAWGSNCHPKSHLRSIASSYWRSREDSRWWERRRRDISRCSRQNVPKLDGLQQERAVRRPIRVAWQGEE